ncbi:arylsulfatase [Mucilaginibacter arboris]|uniref:Sulfatase-like hydrolase/transferase n=1 Tax=Mucilaginibacter arboris TaxID=2682090 RepID=A0A7K1SW34_9SPHI|nr:arylsulfatase [Mucilaginibacter arboris]MVN21535.1 sulfatase-like hydrolase/transferase [Mucilaginibacter arboris]
MKARLIILSSLVLLFISGLFLSFSLPEPPQKKPNIIIILADDMGYSDIGCFGSDVQTPNLDEMAKGGLKMTQFYNASRCCPTRASLLTGLYQHQAGVGDMMNTRPQPAYQGYLNQNCVTIAEAIKAGGYNTLMAGKWHVGQAPEHWPVKRGFDHYFGLIDGASSYFSDYPYRPNQKLTIALEDQPFTPGKGYYSTNAYTDYAIKFIRQNKQTDKPFFLYLAYQCPHWPLQALPEDIAKYKGKFMEGWDKLREKRYQKLLEYGIINKNTKLSPRDEHVPAWETLTEKEKVRWDDKMAVYSAMIDRMDQNIGRLRQTLKDLGEDKNTVIMFLSDNGASSESIKGPGFLPSIIEASRKPSSDPTSFTSYEFAGANLSDAPFRLFKHWEYEGGTATPFIAYGPGIVKPGNQVNAPAHIIDLMSTCLDLAGVAYPKTYHQNKIAATEGISLVPLFKGQAWKGHQALFFEHEGNRAVRQGEWKLVSNYPEKNWHLYNMENDRSELNDLSASNPEKVKELDILYTAWTKRAGVLPFETLGKGKGE